MYLLDDAEPEQIRKVVVNLLLSSLYLTWGKKVLPNPEYDEAASDWSKDQLMDLIISSFGDIYQNALAAGIISQETHQAWLRVTQSASEQSHIEELITCLHEVLDGEKDLSAIETLDFHAQESDSTDNQERESDDNESDGREQSGESDTGAGGNESGRE